MKFGDKHNDACLLEVFDRVQHNVRGESWNDKKVVWHIQLMIENLMTSPCKCGERVGQSYFCPLEAELEPFHTSIIDDWVCR